MKFKCLYPTEFEPFIDRFYRFRDACIVKMELFLQQLHPQCILTIDALDKKSDYYISNPAMQNNQSSNQFFGLSRLIIILRDIKEFYWPVKWHGGFDLDSIQITEHGGSIIFAIRSYDDEDVSPKTLEYLINIPESRPFFYCRSVEYNIIQPYPHAELWDQLKVNHLQKERIIKHNAPSEYKPGSSVMIFLKRIIEAGDPSEFSPNTIIALIAYPDGSVIEIPDHWLEEIQ